MALPSIDGVDYQVRIKWLLHGQQCFNVLNFTGRGVQDLIDNLVQPILTCIVDNLLPVLSNEITLLGADVKNVSGSTAQEGEVSLSSANVGGESNNSLPSTNAAVLSLKTTHPGRTGRGRMFVPGIDEAHQASSQLDATFIAAAVAFIACMVSAFVNSDPLATPFFHWCVRSRKDNQNYPITTAVAKTVVATLRSRKIG